jgi:hypothetical protein
VVYVRHCPEFASSNEEKHKKIYLITTVINIQAFVYYYLFNLFNGAASISDYISFNSRTIAKNKSK